MHYFNGLDQLMFNNEEFSTKPLSDYSQDVRKKIKILSYLKKTLKTEQAKISLTHRREVQTDDSIVYLKKWSQTDGKLIFKLSSKLMHIVNSDHSEILLKYDVGSVEKYLPNHHVTSTTLNKDAKKLLF